MTTTTVPTAHAPFDAFAHAQALLTGLGGPDADELPPAGGVRLHEPAGGTGAACEALLAGVWSALARPGALAIN